jgi:hypothetical protein
MLASLGRKMLWTASTSLAGSPSARAAGAVQAAATSAMKTATAASPGIGHRDRVEVQ